MRTSSSKSSSTRNYSGKDKVIGARRVWGTTSLCTVSAVRSAINKFCGISTIHVRRKTSTIYYIIVSDDECLSVREHGSIIVSDNECLSVREHGNIIVSDNACGQSHTSSVVDGVSPMNADLAASTKCD